MLNSRRCVHSWNLLCPDCRWLTRLSRFRIDWPEEVLCGRDESNMDITQLAQAVTWLQEEHRRDKLELDRLTQQLEALRKENVEQVNRVKDLEGRLVKQSTQLAQVTQLESSLEKARREVSLLIQNYEKDRQQAEKDAAVVRQKEREAINKTIEALYQEVQKIAEMESLQRIPYIEDLARRNERNIQQLQTLDAELRQQQKQSTEALQLAEVKLERQIAQWRTEVQTLRQMIEEYAAQIGPLKEQVFAGRNVLQPLSQFEERLKKQQEQAAELQRLAEERQKRELAEWHAENEKRWKQWETTSDRHLANFRAQATATAKRLERIEKLLAVLTEQVGTLWRAQRAFAYHRVSEVQQWVTDFEKLWDEYEQMADDGGEPRP